MHLRRSAIVSMTGATLALAAGMACAKQKVKLVLIGPLAGGVSANGTGARNSADLAVRLRNEDAEVRAAYFG